MPVRTAKSASQKATAATKAVKAAVSTGRPTIDSVREQFAEWRRNKRQIERLSKAQDDSKTGLKTQLKAAVEQLGERDEKGNLLLDLGEPIDGYRTLKNERRVTQTLNGDRAEGLLTGKGIIDRCTSLVLRVTDQEKAIVALRKAKLLDEEGAFSIERILDEELILKAFYEGHLTQAELDGLFDVKEIFAFVPQRG